MKKAAEVWRSLSAEEKKRYSRPATAAATQQEGEAEKAEKAEKEGNDQGKEETATDMEEKEESQPQADEDDHERGATTVAAV